ncbi:MAG: Ig-like domain-containing protein, partial [Firmicutes bacterium]|nr:Ig-like domain-containing protein [Bacillota bacterium]
KLAVEGELENYYVLSDDGTPGTISINVVDAMLCAKYRGKRTQPDPGYDTGWIYDNMVKRCSFYIFAKGHDGERQTAELVLDHISIDNNQPAVTGVQIISEQIVGNSLTKLKGSESVTLSSAIMPASIANHTILWSSADESIATVDTNGAVSFIGVGKTVITAKSQIDQSKTATLDVNVTSGFENPTTLKSELTSLTYAGSTEDVAHFTDLFHTTWGTGIIQPVTLESMNALDDHLEGTDIVVENYFSSGNSTYVNEATSHLTSGKAHFALTLTGTSSATVYRNIGGALYQENYSSGIAINYASFSTTWTKLATYEEQTIVVWGNGSVYKYDVTVLNCDAVGNYTPSDFMNTSLWTVPDRTKQAIDPVVHALSPAAISVSGSDLVMRQNKYPEAKYCFGGIVSNVLTSTQDQPVQMLLNITALNQMNDYVKTMWEIKILYYQSNGTTVVSSNPIKIQSGNTIGLQTVTFTPTYNHYRFYLVVNGSDIGDQFAGAEMRLSYFKIYGIA